MFEISIARKPLHSSSGQAAVLWGLFIIAAVIINGTIPFLLGQDVREWTASPFKGILFDLFVYAGIFLVVPLLVTKGLNILRQPGFLFPLCAAILAICTQPYFRPAVAISVVVLAYLHRRYDLSRLGFRSNGWKMDILAILFLAITTTFPGLLSSGFRSFSPMIGLSSMLDRMVCNPASTVENMFYFGFLAERLSSKTGKWLTPFLIGGMYTAHEMTNPEYWYEGKSFPLIFIGMSIITAIYLWRRSVIVIWLSDGLARFFGR